MEAIGRAKCNIFLLIKSGINFCLLLHPGSVFCYMFHRFCAVFVTPIRTGHLTDHSIRSRQKSNSVFVTLKTASLSNIILQKSSIFMRSDTYNCRKRIMFYFHNHATLFSDVASWKSSHSNTIYI